MDNPIAFAILAVSLLAVVYISWWGRKFTSSTKDFYVAGGKISPRLNGWAMFGDYCSAASFLGVAGAIALAGVDSWWVAIGFFGAWIFVLVALAGPLKSSGKFTVGDVLVGRFGGRSLKFLAMFTTVVIGTLYLVPQIVGAGHLFELLLGWDYMVTVVVAAVVMGLMVVLGGMMGTTYNQAIQGVILLVAMLLLFVLAAALYFGGNPLGIIGSAMDTVPPTEAVKVIGQVVVPPPAEGVAHGPFVLAEAVRQGFADLPNALTPGVGVPDVWSQLSLVLGLLLGVAGLPHILIRFYTVKDAKDAKKGAEITIIGLAVFYIAVLFVGFATMMILYDELIQMLAAGERGRATNMAIPLLGMELGGEVVLGIIAAGAMAAMLSTAVGLLISMTTSLSHDVYAGVLRPQSSDRERLVFAKLGAVVLTVIALAASVWLKDQNVAILVAMCFGIAASTFAPVLILSVWWKGLTKEGVITGLLVGLVVSLVFTFARFAEVPELLGIRVLGNPALYGVPAALFSIVVVSLLTKTTGNAREFMALAHRDT
ncbi:cation acetate symporter [Silanimonas sp.]|uniref:sodium/solute symporter n=1 Tax=Silanimonas sp. TaxID=1929290 RepID=UPI001BB88BB6|nr:cation acetate symporter [Silanimonas sp.]MBS3896805.1 cation acetate symporter [Silanimonas sp.]MBS3924167.1 cation acetate symporter [Xanthomonadaceae bacterium]